MQAIDFRDSDILLSPHHDDFRTSNAIVMMSKLVLCLFVIDAKDLETLR